MFHRLRARATVLACVVLALATYSSACTDTTGLPGDPTSTGFSDEDSAFRRGGMPGPTPGKGTVASLEISPETFVLTAGGVTTLSAVARNERGKLLDNAPSWASSDPTVASVNGGEVKALKAGTALITAIADGVADTATARVSPEVILVDSVVVSPAAASVIVGESVTMTARPIDLEGETLADRAVTWASSDASIVTVTSTGKAMGVASGSARVKATADGVASEVTVTVAPVPPVPVASLVLTPSPASVKEGATLQLVIVLKDASGGLLVDRSLTWASSNSDVVKVSSAGLLTGVGAGTATVTATSEGREAAVSVTVSPSTIPVASVSMSQASGSIAAGASLQLVATPKDASGEALTGRTITWTTSSASLATVSASGLVRGVAAGSATITAAAEGQRGTSAITVTAAPAPTDPPPTDPTTPPTTDPTPTERVGYYVAPNGSSGGSGTKASPWDLGSVLAGNKPVGAGDTVWVRGGTYRGEFFSYLAGNSSRLLVVRQYPGERATIDGNLAIYGSYVAFWGLEVTSSSPSRTEGGSHPMGVNVRAPGSKLINMVVHDIGYVAIGSWMEASSSEVYGSVIYNNGYEGTDRGHGHSIYVQNNSGSKRIADNIMFNSFGYGIHAYTSDGQYNRNVLFEGNVAFNSGTLSARGTSPDIFVGGNTVASGITVSRNFTWRSDGELTADLGWYWGPRHLDLTFTDNLLVGGLHLDPSDWTTITQRNNVVTTAGSATQVFVRPNQYERGRANITVYNWGQQGSVSANVSNVLASGDRYEVRNAQNFYGTPVATGTYGGGSISLPLNAVTPVAPRGGSARAPVSTGSRFHVFVLLKTN